MTRATVFAARNRRELLRDPLNFAFALGFPIVVMLLLTAIQANIPVALFQIENLVPGIAVFGLSFISLFSGMLIAKDRTSSFLMRLFASPMRSGDFIIGYVLPLLPLAMAQTAICYLVAFVLGLAPTFSIFVAWATLLPSAVFFIGVGLLVGSLLNDKQVGGVCGALLTNLCAWLSGAWFDLNLVGGAFKQIAYLLPFAHAVDAGRTAVSGEYAGIFPHLWWVIGYAVAISLVAVLAFRGKMKSENG